MSPMRIEPLGEQGLLLRLGDTIDPAINARVHSLALHLRSRPPAWLLDVVPAYASLAILVSGDALVDAGDPLQGARDWLLSRLDEATPTIGQAMDDTGSTAHEIPVCYDGDCAPDLDDIAAIAGLPRDEVISRHMAGDYRVALIGFAPGFPYLLGLDPALAVPRLPTPRTRVPAGSVAIGGAQAGLYPRESPGGWRLLGRTPLRLFDATALPPALLAPGDRVRFTRISDGQFARLESTG